MKMINYESGVDRYITGSVNVEIGFPVDTKGKEHVYCEMCKLYNGKRCYLTGEIIPFPSTHIGNMCPMTFEDHDAIEPEVDF